LAHPNAAPDKAEIFHLSISLPSVILLPLSIVLPFLYIPLGRPYILSNILALSLGTATLALLKLDSFLTAFLLLGVLLIYDIFWVGQLASSTNCISLTIRFSLLQ